MTTENHTIDENYKAYYDALAMVLLFVGIGVVLAIAGLQWGMQGFSTAIVETETGVTFVEGGASDGAFLGPILGAVGLVLVVLGCQLLNPALEWRARNAQ